MSKKEREKGKKRGGGRFMSGAMHTFLPSVLKRNAVSISSIVH